MNAKFNPHEIAKLIDKTYWKSTNSNNIDSNTIYGIFLHNTYPNVNNDKVYQIVIRSFTPGYNWLSDMYDQIGGIYVDGTIEYSGSIGILNDVNTIKWLAGKTGVWNKLDKSSFPVPTSSSYSREDIQEGNKIDTNYILNKYQQAYPYYSQFTGN
jgi:hypothetical protein